MGHPWDEDLKSLAAAFGSQLRTVVATIDQYGLRQRHLGKHRRDIERFFRTIAAAPARVAEGYQEAAEVQGQTVYLLGLRRGALEQQQRGACRERLRLLS